MRQQFSIPITVFYSTSVNLMPQKSTFTFEFRMTVCQVHSSAR